MLNWFKKKPTEAPTMSYRDIQIIAAFADSNEGREEAVAAYRRNIREFGGANIYMQFMAEVDSTAPDFTLRSNLRKAILATIKLP